MLRDVGVAYPNDDSCCIVNVLFQPGSHSKSTTPTSLRVRRENTVRDVLGYFLGQVQNAEPELGGMAAKDLAACDKYQVYLDSKPVDPNCTVAFLLLRCPRVLELTVSEKHSEEGVPPQLRKTSQESIPSVLDAGPGGLLKVGQVRKKGREPPYLWFQRWFAVLSVDDYVVAHWWDIRSIEKAVLDSLSFQVMGTTNWAPPLGSFYMYGDVSSVERISKKGKTTALKLLTQGSASVSLRFRDSFEADAWYITIQLAIENAPPQPAWRVQLLRQKNNAEATLYYHVQHSEEPAIRTLLAGFAGAPKVEDPDAARGEDGRSALCMACSTGNNSIVTMLCGAGASVNSHFTENRCTALHFACESGHGNTATLLVCLGADKRAVDKKGRRAIEIATGDAVAVMQRLEAEDFLDGWPTQAMEEGRSLSSDETADIAEIIYTCGHGLHAMQASDLKRMNVLISAIRYSPALASAIAIRSYDKWVQPSVVEGTPLIVHCIRCELLPVVSVLFQLGVNFESQVVAVLLEVESHVRKRLSEVLASSPCSPLHPNKLANLEPVNDWKQGEVVLWCIESRNIQLLSWLMQCIDGTLGGSILLGLNSETIPETLLPPETKLIALEQLEQLRSMNTLLSRYKAVDMAVTPFYGGICVPADSWTSAPVFVRFYDYGDDYDRDLDLFSRLGEYGATIIEQIDKRVFVLTRGQPISGASTTTKQLLDAVKQVCRIVVTLRKDGLLLDRIEPNMFTLVDDQVLVSDVSSVRPSGDSHDDGEPGDVQRLSLFLKVLSNNETTDQPAKNNGDVDPSVSALLHAMLHDEPLTGRSITDVMIRPPLSEGSNGESGS